MGIERYMVVIKFSFCVLLVLQLVAAVSSIEKKETQDGFVRQLFDSASGLLDEHTAKVFRTTCCEDFIHLKKEDEYHDLCLLLELFAGTNKVSSTVRPVAQADIQKLLNACHPQIKEIFLHCLRKNNLLLHVLGEEDDSKIWHVTNIGYLFSTSSIPRRNPGRVLLQLISEPPGLGPAVGSPTPSLTPSPEPSLPPLPEPSLSPSPAPAPLLPNPISPPLSPASFFPDRKSVV